MLILVALLCLVGWIVAFVAYHVTSQRAMMASSIISLRVMAAALAGRRCRLSSIPIA